MSIDRVIGWKFNNQEGMRCEEIDGVMQIVEFPGGVPSQAEQDAWTAEYDAWVAGGGLLDKQADLTKVDPRFRALVLALSDGSFVPGANYTNAQIKDIIKAHL